MQASTEAILQYNAGRDPERLALKLRMLGSDPFVFFRGTAPLFYATLELPRMLQDAPRVLACGDLHLENFGSYKGDNRLVYFDINDFDEACVAPLSFEVVRFLAGILVAAEHLKVGAKQADLLMATFVDSYALTLVSAKPRWVERSTATGAVKALLQSVKDHQRRDLITRRTEQKKGNTRLIIDGKRTLAASSADRAAAESILAAYASSLRFSKA